MPGDVFGIVEQGAVVQLATPSMALAIAMCAARTFTMTTFQPYIVQGSLTVSLFVVYKKIDVAKNQTTFYFIY